MAAIFVRLLSVVLAVACLTQCSAKPTHQNACSCERKYVDDAMVCVLITRPTKHHMSSIFTKSCYCRAEWRISDNKEEGRYAREIEHCEVECIY